MQNGVFRKVIPTVREGQEYNLSDINPKVANAESLTDFWQHIEKAFKLSASESAFSTSDITSIGKKIELLSERIQDLCKEIESDLSKDLTTFFAKTRDPYKPEVTGVRIDGFKDGQLFGVVGLDRALPKNDDDLNQFGQSTVPFQENEAEADFIDV